MSLTDFVIMTFFIAFSLAFADAAQVTWRRSRGWKRWAGGLALTIPALFLFATIAVLVRGAIIAFMPRDVPLVALAPTSPAEPAASAPAANLVARGEHIARTTCMSCHSPDNTLPLRGGNNLADIIDVGEIYAPNLTPGGPLATWSDEEIVRAIRNGVDISGRKLVAMPTDRLRNMSDEDLAAVIAYLRSQPAVANETPKYIPWMVLYVLMGFNVITDTVPVLEPVVAPERGPTAAYGDYLVSYRDCRNCHGEALDGEEKRYYPTGISLTHVRDWTLAEFITVMRTGISPDGHTLAPPMAWQSYGAMDDVELAAVHAYIKSIPRAAAKTQ